MYRQHGPNKKQSSTGILLFATTAVVIASLQAIQCSIVDPLGAIPRVSLPLTSKGIVVPKRPAIIAGLDHSFRGRQTSANTTGTGSNSGASTTGSKSLLSSLTGLRNQQQASNKKHSVLEPQQQALYLDRKQQELLAANPNYANGAGQLLKRSDVTQANNVDQQQQQQQQHQSVIVHRLLLQSPQQQAAAATNQFNATIAESSTSARDQAQQQYRGYSLIELEVRSEQDRRYVQELYANLSAALNEQANRPQSLTVSPYADIDFWSFKNGVNDQIDIMLSPKSRQFILNQLTRAKIKHRVKIDDIQARLEQQLSPGHSSTSEQLQLSGRQSPNNVQEQQQPQQKQDKLSSRQDMPSAQTGSSPIFMNDSLFFENYQRLGDINQYLESLVGRARDIARVQVIGRSSQGRYLRVLRLGYEQLDADGSTSDDTIASSVNSADQSAPSSLNASRILDQFLRHHQSVRKLGSIWLDGGTHAREWISPSTVLYMAFRLTDNHSRCQRFFDQLRQAIQQHGSSSELAARRHDEPQLDSDLLMGINEINTSLLSSGGSSSTRQRPRTELEQKMELLAKKPQEVASEYACDLELEQLLRRYTFYIQPVLNPDGYEYSHTHNRLWRKTRSTSSHPIYRHFCLGADPNRNYDARHGSTGSSSHPCSQTYGGTTPFTEPETRHQSNFVYAHRSNMKMYISFHSYSQMILLPYSHSKQLAPDHKDLESVGQAAVKAIERTHGTQYRVGPSASILYTASGTASDWAYEKAGIKYSYTIELRDTGSYGFLLPKQQIIPTGEETFNGLLAMIAQMEKNDNLLMPKSSPVSSLAGNLVPANASSGQPTTTADFVHAPDLDQLRPFGRFRPRPAQLENALDGSDTWATPEPRPPGVRDRKPVSNSIDEALQANRGSNDLSRFHPLEAETISTSDNEPDAGLTFEGEGELMEPTNLAARAAEESHGSQDNGVRQHGSILDSSELVAAAKEANEQAALNARSAALVAEKFRRRNENNLHTLGLSSNGRSLINNPPQGTRTVASLSRRESSEDMKAGNVLLAV